MDAQLKLVVLTFFTVNYILMENVKTPSVEEQKTEPIFAPGQSKVFLSCSIKLSNGKPLKQYNVTWLKGDVLLSELEDSDRFSVSGKDTLVINNPTLDDAGMYVARFENTDHFPQHYNCNVGFLAKPIMQDFGRAVNFAVGDTLKLHCNVKGFPIIITWYKDDNIINSVINNTRVLMMSHNGIKNSILQITNLKLTDSGIYRCQAQSSFFNSTRSKSIEVRITELLAAIWPFMGITAEVLVLCVIVLLCERHEKRKNMKLLSQQAGKVSSMKKKQKTNV